MKQTKLVIFDMDGLLFDTEQLSFRALKEVMETREYEFTLDHYKQLIGIPDRESDVVFLKMYGEDFPFELIVGEYQERLRVTADNEGIPVMRGAEQLLHALEERGMKKCIASSSSRETIKRYLDQTGLESRFDFYISGDDVQKGKPNPDIFLEACRIAGVPVDAAVVLEDSLNGLKAACAANINCIIVPDIIEPTDEMKEKAYRIVGDLEQVIGLLD